MAKSYTEENIQTLDPMEHIRLRPGMYIGAVGDGSSYDEGIYILLKEVIDNVLDEFADGYGKRCTITINYETGDISVRDYGRGIPLGSVIDCISKVNTGARFEKKGNFEFSIGMNGVGLKAVNALSTHFRVVSYREGHFQEAIFAQGKLLDAHKGTTHERNGTLVEFRPDNTIFPNYHYREALIRRRMQMYAVANIGLSFDVNGERFLSEKGILNLIENETADDALYLPLTFKTRDLEVAFTHTHHMGETYYSFVNGQYTSEGGPHIAALKEGLLKGINAFAKKRYEGDILRDGIVASLTLRLKDAMFDSQTKSKLGDLKEKQEIIQAIRKGVEDELHRHPETARKLLAKINETAKIRAEIASVKKLVRERTKSTSIHVPQLTDCKHHYDGAKQKHEETMLFLVEGLSAGGTIKMCRDTMTQAVFTLRGKTLNVCDETLTSARRNEELNNLILVLGIEKSLETLRYNKIVIATDADVDGMHIRLLLVTFFMRFFEPLIRDGHLFILETPLFRVRNAKHTLYCYSEVERDHALNVCGAKAEITRFKGLGEINAKEFKTFIGEGIRLTPVDISQDIYTHETLRFLMGKNTPERRQHILNNLVVDNTDF